MVGTIDLRQFVVNTFALVGSKLTAIIRLKGRSGAFLLPRLLLLLGDNRGKAASNSLVVRLAVVLSCFKQDKRS